MLRRYETMPAGLDRVKENSNLRMKEFRGFGKFSDSLRTNCLGGDWKFTSPKTGLILTHKLTQKYLSEVNNGNFKCKAGLVKVHCASSDS